jgi:predicted ATPase
MLRRISITAFKSLVEVDFELPRLVVLAGPNAAGKSNILDAIQMLARTGTQRTLADALAEPIRGFPVEAFTLPRGGLPALLQQASARFTIEADLQMSNRDGADAARARYRVGVDIDPDTGVLSLADEYLTKATKKWAPRDTPRIESIDDGVLIRRSSGGGRPLHEELHVNHTYLSDTRLSGAPYPLFDAVRAEFGSWRTHYLDPQRSMRLAAPPRDVADIGVRGEHLAPFLYGLKTRQHEAFAAVGRALRTVIPAVTSLDVDLDTKRGTLDIQIEQDGTTFSSRVISEGTLRVLALCAIAATATRGLVAFEEPENGVQPQRLDRVAELLTSVARRGDAQMVVTTHSPGFVAEVIARTRAESELIGLFSVGRDGRQTVVRRLNNPGLWSEPAIDEMLREPDEHDKISAVVRRGWLDV